MSATFTHQGLPEGAKPFDLPDLLEQLRTRLGLCDEHIAYIRYLLRKVRAAAFQPRPICAVWEAVATQAADLGFDVRRITRIVSQLETRGPDGRIIVVGGVNLGPLIEHQTQVSERLRNDRERAIDVIRANRGIRAEPAPQARVKCSQGSGLSRSTTLIGLLK